MADPIGWTRLHSHSTVAVALLVLVGCPACTGGSGGSTRTLGPSEYPGFATISFDGHPVGRNSASSYPHIGCAVTTDPVERLIITPRGGDWVPSGGGPLASLWLEVSPDGDPPAKVEFSIGDAVYRPGPSTVIDSTLSDDPVPEGTRFWDGYVVLKDVPIVVGVPYEGRDSIGELVVDWECGTA